MSGEWNWGGVRLARDFLALPSVAETYAPSDKRFENGNNARKASGTQGKTERIIHRFLFVLSHLAKGPRKNINKSKTFPG